MMYSITSFFDTSSFNIDNEFAPDIQSGHNLNPHEEIQDWIKSAIVKILPHAREDLFKDFYLSLPPSHIKADYAMSTFFLKEEFMQDTTSIAVRIVENCLKEPISLIKKVYAMGPYVNIEVNKSMYYEMAVNHILSQKDMFGSFKNENPQLIHINYFDTDMRVKLVGQVIGRHYEQGGHTVAHNQFTTDDLQVIPVGREMINNALKYKVAEYVSNTNAVMTLPTKHSPSIILQRHDRSLTRDALYLAYQKTLIRKGKPSRLIYITSMDQSKTAETLMLNMRLMKHIGAEVTTSTVFVDQSDLHQHISSKGLAAKYAVLRTPIDKKVFFNEKELLVYSGIKDVILRLEQESQKSKNMDFDVAKLLITFPDVVANVTDSHRPDILCAYLENVAELCDKRSVYKNEKLSRTASIVLQNGLRLLFS